VIPWNQVTPSKSDRSGKGHQSSKLLQERVSKQLYLEKSGVAILHIISVGDVFDYPVLGYFTNV